MPLPLCRGQRINGRNSSFFVPCESQGIKTRSSVLVAITHKHWATTLAYGMIFEHLKKNKSNMDVTSTGYMIDLFMHNIYLYKIQNYFTLQDTFKRNILTNSSNEVKLQI